MGWGILGDAADFVADHLPGDPVAFVKDKVIEILNYMGYEWPSTDSGVLDGWAEQWDGLQAQLNSYISDLEAV